jgi:hypothetical protein
MESSIRHWPRVSVVLRYVWNTVIFTLQLKKTKRILSIGPTGELWALLGALFNRIVRKGEKDFVRIVL